MKTKRFKYRFNVEVKVKPYDAFGGIDSLDEMFEHYKKYIRTLDSTARFTETGFGFCISDGSKDASYRLTSERPWKLGPLFKNIRRYLKRRNFTHIEVGVENYEDN